MSFSRMLRKFLEKNTQWTPSTEESLIRGVAALSQYNIVTGDYEGAEEVVEVLSRWWIVTRIKEGGVPASVRFQMDWDDWGYEGSTGHFVAQEEGQWPVVAVGAKEVLAEVGIQFGEVLGLAEEMAEERGISRRYEPEASYTIEWAINRLVAERIHPYLMGRAYEPSVEEETESEDERLERGLTSHLAERVKS